MKNILLATDLTANSDRAMERAFKLAWEHDAKLHVLHVISDYKEKSLSISLKKQTQDLIKKHMYEYKRSNPLVTVSVNTVLGKDAFDEILRHAEKIKANLIVMGMHGKTKFRDLFKGTTIERVIRKGRKPVLVVKNKPLSHYKNITVGVDYAPDSRTTFRTALALAPEGHVNALHVYRSPDYIDDLAYVYMTLKEKGDTDEAQQNKMETFLKTEAKHFKRKGMDISKICSGSALEGLPYNAILKEAKRAKSDLIVTGAHGESVLSLSKLGSTAHEILSDPPCDVLITRHSSD